MSFDPALCNLTIEDFKSTPGYPTKVVCKCGQPLHIHPRDHVGGAITKDIVKVLKDTNEALKRAAELLKEFKISQNRAILDYVSTASDQERHQRDQEAAAREYYGCIDPKDNSRTICMVTGVSGSGEQVVCSHILPVRGRSRMGDVGLLSNNVWDEYNCLLLAKPIEYRMVRGEVVLLFDQTESCYKLLVVYKEILSQNLEKGGVRITKSNLNLPGGNATAVFGDIHGWKLNYPASCAGPYHTVMLLMAEAYLHAAEGRDSVLQSVIPSRSQWASWREQVLALCPESKNTIIMKRFLNDL